VDANPIHHILPILHILENRVPPNPSRERPIASLSACGYLTQISRIERGIKKKDKERKENKVKPIDRYKIQ